MCSFNWSSSIVWIHDNSDYRHWTHLVHDKWHFYTLHFTLCKRLTRQLWPVVPCPMSCVHCVCMSQVTETYIEPYTAPTIYSMPVHHWTPTVTYCVISLTWWQSVPVHRSNYFDHGGTTNEVWPCGPLTTSAEYPCTPVVTMTIVGTTMVWPGIPSDHHGRVRSLYMVSTTGDHPGTGHGMTMYPLYHLGRSIPVHRR